MCERHLRKTMTSLLVVQVLMRALVVATVWINRRAMLTRDGAVTEVAPDSQAQLSP